MDDKNFQIPKDIVSNICNKKLTFPLPVKLFMGLICSPMTEKASLTEELQDHFGEIEIESPITEFDHTDYYHREMGRDLKRCFIGFKTPVSPDRLSEIKLLTNRIEIKTGHFKNDKVYRTVNCDPGILTLSNIILATTKNQAHRIYLSKGIYAEVTLIYSKSAGWRFLDWTYPDYRLPMSLEFFKILRKRYHFQIKDLLSKKCLKP